MSITKTYRPDRKSKFGVKWSIEGSRKFKFFQTERERDFYYRKLIEKEKKGEKAILRISAKDAIILESCINKLGDSETVLKACLEYEKRYCPKAVKMSEAIKEWLENAYNTDKDAGYIRMARNILNRFNLSFTCNTNEISKDDAQKWIYSLSKFAPITVINHSKILKAFYNWCIERQYAIENPFLKLFLPQSIKPEAEFISPGDMKKIMKVAKKHVPESVAYFALNGFAGLRSSACAKIDIEDIKFDQKGILIRAINAKNKKRIYVDGHPDNLWNWLTWAKENAPEGFTLIKSHWDKLKRKVQKLADVKIPHNGLRHSFCTYHVALNGDAGKTATLLTHRGNVSILYEHYKGNTTKAQAEKYFSIFL